MATNEQLFKLTTEGAVVRMINDANGTLFDGSKAGPLVISHPIAVGGIRTEVEISVRKALSSNEEVPYPGTLYFRYNRLDVASTLIGKLAGWRPPMPSSTQEVLNELTRRTGINFELTDFILEDIVRSNAAPYILKAKPESLRWVGQLEVTLLDLTNLALYLPAGLPTTTQTLKFTIPAYSNTLTKPYMNATNSRKLLNNVANGAVVSAVSDNLAKFIQNSIPAIGKFLMNDSQNSAAAPNATWELSQTVGPYQLTGATLVNKDVVITPTNLLAPQANRAVRIQLGALNSHPSKQVDIPYSLISFNDSTFTDKPRLKQSSVVNGSNGTLWNKWLNSLVAPSIITSIPGSVDFRPSGPDRWVASANAPSPTNLYNAVVQYNGSRRAYDIEPYFEECNRIIVLTVSDSNSAYQGNLIFHYRAPIIINEVLPDAAVGMLYDFDLNPREGSGGYSILKVSGNWAGGHILDNAFHVKGTATQEGSHNVVLNVTDSSNTTVRYNLTYRVVIRDMQIQISPPLGRVGEAYSCDFTVTGGVPGYSYRLIDHNTPAGEIALVSVSTPRLVGTFQAPVGRRNYTLEVGDTRGVTTSLPFGIEVR